MKQKRVVSVSFFLMGVLYCICLVVSNLFGTKLVQVGSYSMTAGLIVFPISYIINDCVAEVWGFRKARLIIWVGFAMNFFVVLLGAIAVALPPAPIGWPTTRTSGSSSNWPRALPPPVSSPLWWAPSSTPS